MKGQASRAGAGDDAGERAGVLVRSSGNGDREVIIMANDENRYVRFRLFAIS